MLLPLRSLLITFSHWTNRQLDIRLIKKGVYGSDLLHSITFYTLWGQSSDWGFDDTISNKVKPRDFWTGSDQRLASEPLLPPAILDHSYSLTHIDQVCAERREMEWCEALCGMLRHLRRRSGLIASSIPSVTLDHVAFAYWISLNEMLLCPTLLPLTLKPNQENDQIIIPCW